MDSVTSPTDFTIFSIRVLISPVALFVCADKLDISVATTANPLPASPALAASMLAFNARRPV